MTCVLTASRLGKRVQTQTNKQTNKQTNSSNNSSTISNNSNNRNNSSSSASPPLFKRLAEHLAPGRAGATIASDSSGARHGPRAHRARQQARELLALPLAQLDGQQLRALHRARKRLIRHRGSAIPTPSMSDNLKNKQRSDNRRGRQSKWAWCLACNGSWLYDHKIKYNSVLPVWGFMAD